MQGHSALEYKREAPRALVGPRRGRQESMITDEFSIPDLYIARRAERAPGARGLFWRQLPAADRNLSWGQR